MEPPPTIPKTPPKLPPIDTSTSANNGPQTQNVLAPLSAAAAAAFSPRFSIVSRKSYTSEDYTRQPEEAEGVQVKSVAPGQIALVRVLSRCAGGGGGGGGRRGGKEMEVEMQVERGEGGNGAAGAAGAAEICVNGEAYVLHPDAVFRPLNFNMTTKTHYKGYAVHANGVFKLLGGSPAAIEAGTLFRVTPTNRYSTTTTTTPTTTTTTTSSSSSTPRALHRIKNVSRLLSHGTSGSEEYLYVYDPHWDGFVRTEETRRFPPEKPIGAGARSEEDEEDDEDEEELLFDSADRALRRRRRRRLRLNRLDVVHRQSLCLGLPVERRNEVLARSLTLPAPRRFVAPREAPTTLGVFAAAAAGGGGPVGEKGAQVVGEASSWLNIDFQASSPVSNAPPPLEEIREDGNSVHVEVEEEVSSPHLNAHACTPSGSAASLNGFTVASSQVSPTTVFHKPMDYFQGPARYAHGGSVLVVCFTGSQASSRPRLARIVIPSSAERAFDDMDLLVKMNEEYQKLRGVWRRVFSLKGLKGIDLVECHKNTKRRITPGLFHPSTHGISTEKLLADFLKPCAVAGDHNWVEWVRVLNSEDGRYALEFIEGWRADKIVVTVLLPVALSVAGGVAWCLVGPDQMYLTAFVLGLFVLLLGWAGVGLLMLVSWTV